MLLMSLLLIFISRLLLGREFFFSKKKLPIMTMATLNKHEDIKRESIKINLFF